MYLISEYAALVVLIVTLSAVLFGFGVVILGIQLGIERLVLRSREVQRETTRVFSPSAVFDAPHRAAIGAGIPVRMALEQGGKHGLPSP